MCNSKRRLRRGSHDVCLAGEAPVTCLAFVVLKAFHAFESFYDWPIALLLLGLDLIAWPVWWRWLRDSHGR